VETMPPPRERKLAPAERFGVKFISTAFLIKPDQALVWRGPMLHSAINQLLTDVDWGELDYLVIDLPPGTGDAQLTLAQVLPLTGAVIVTQPMQVAAADARRSIKMFEQLNVPIIGVVENMSGDFFGSGAGELLATEHEVAYLGKVPLEAQVRIGGDSGEPIVVSQPESAAAQALVQVTEAVAARVSVLTIGKQSNVIPIQMIG
jgi:ATP-binding protein involved in chromosome partitioning